MLTIRTSAHVVGAVVCLLLVAGGPARAQRDVIPTSARYEITFTEVEAAAGLPEMRTLPFSAREARLMQRPWSSEGEVPFLRVFERNGRMQAQLYFFWNAATMSPFRRPQGADVLCRDRACVRPAVLAEQQDWMRLVSLAAQDACPRPLASVLSVCGDCPQLYVKTSVDGQYREQSCETPLPGTLAEQVLSLLSRASEAAQAVR